MSMRDVAGAPSRSANCLHARRLEARRAPWPRLATLSERFIDQSSGWIEG